MNAFQLNLNKKTLIVLKSISNSCILLMAVFLIVYITLRFEYISLTCRIVETFAV